MNPLPIPFRLKSYFKIQSSLKRIALVALLLNGFVAHTQSVGTQNMNGFINNQMPIPPTTFQFLKFDELPVTEYNGLPEITIPIFSVNEGDFSLPLSLEYHAGGVRVSEEAGWVGLNWNLDVGHVIQLVNDRDDLDRTRYTAVMPDYYGSFGNTRSYPKNELNTGAAQPVPTGAGILASQPYHSFILWTNYWVPINGAWYKESALFNGSETAQGDFNDSEPDIFKAVFGEHYLEFLIDPKTSSLVVLNKKNYKVEKINNSAGKSSWKVTAPDGTQFYFEKIDEVSYDMGYTSFRGVTTPDIASQPLGSRLWHLTKIVTTSNRTIKLAWSDTTPILTLPPVLQQKMFRTFGPISSIPSENYTFAFRPHGLMSPAPPDVSDIYAVNRPKAQTRSYLDSIKFSSGYVLFKKSNSRTDVTGEARLDSIIIGNLSSVVKKFAFGYDYYVGSAVGGSLDKDLPNLYTQKNLNELIQRLKLVSFGEVNIPKYQFHYDETILPAKTSYAVDYWGFYNGQTNNVSFVANPIHLGSPQFGDIGNDHRPYLAFSKAGTLTEILYPTSGKATFDYELNTLDNQTINVGNGLRVKTVSTVTEFGNVAKKTAYTYAGGQAFSLNLYNSLSFVTTDVIPVNGLSPPSGSYTRNVTADVFSGLNFYTSSLTGTGNSVGYSLVTKTTIDSNGNNIGKTVTRFYNNADIPGYDPVNNVSLPARRSLFPENGLIIRKDVFDSNQHLLSRTINNYQFQMGPLYYGVKTSFNNYYYLVLKFGAQDPGQQVVHEQDMAGYYPLYSGESLLQWTQTSTFNNSDSLTITDNYTYNAQNLVSYTYRYNSKGETINTFYQYPLDYNTSYYASLVSKNMIDQVVSESIQNNNHINVYSSLETYSNFNGLIKVANISASHGSFPSETKMIIDSYDNFGNITQFHKPNDVIHSCIWGYNNTLPIAEVSNANANQIAYSNFEDVDNGGWAYNGVYALGGKTGARGFGGNSITKTNLPSGSYVLSFWAKRAAPSVNGSITGSITASAATDTYQYYTYSLNGITSVTLNLSNIIIDDLRLFPAGAQMTTYVHRPLVGIISKTDPNGQTVQYDYDSQNRLQSIRDNDSNIISNYKYNYKKQN